MDRMKALEVFVAVTESGSFAGAARSLLMSPPSITRVINDLEDYLGAVLLQRTTRKVSLTDIGQHYLEDAKKILAEYEAANDAARGAFSKPKGLLRVTASNLFGQHYITPIIAEYLDLYPDVTVEAVYLDRVVNLVDEGIDLAVRIGNLPDSSMMAVKIGQIRWSICGCPEYFDRNGRPEKVEELADHNIIAVGPVPDHVEWNFADGKSIKLKPRLIYSSVPASIAAVQSGWGISRVLSYQIGPQVNAGGLEKILPDYEPPSIPIHIVRADGRMTSAKVRSFVDLAKTRLRENKLLQ